MTTPPFESTGAERDPGGSPTEPVPTPRFEPAASDSPPASAPPPEGIGAQPGAPFAAQTSLASPAGAPPVGAPPAFQPVIPEPVVPAAPRPMAPRSTSSSRLLNVALAVAVLVATAGVAFALGRTTAPASASTAGRFNGGVGAFGPNASFAPGGNDGARGEGGFAGRGGFGALGGGLSVKGTVESVSADSITIRTQGGQSITIGLDSSTTYHQQSAASASDVQAGKTVILDVSGGFRPGINGNGNNNNNGGTSNGGFSLGTASDVTIVP
jgi:hypothetical protein